MNSEYLKLTDVLFKILGISNLLTCNRSEAFNLIRLTIKTPVLEKANELLDDYENLTVETVSYVLICNRFTDEEKGVTDTRKNFFIDQIISKINQIIRIDPHRQEMVNFIKKYPFLLSLLDEDLK